MDRIAIFKSWPQKTHIAFQEGKLTSGAGGSLLYYLSTLPKSAVSHLF
jgi:hypothetical protein